MIAKDVKDRWTSGDLYERYVGRWSRPVAQEFLAWLGAPAGLDWLEVGCGTGAMTETIAESCAPGRLVGVDTSAGFLDFARQRLGPDRAEFRQADAQALPFADGAFDRVVSGLVLNFVPDQARAAAEMARVAKPGGEVALYVWDYAGKMEHMRHFWDAATALDPRGAEVDESKRFPIWRPEALRQLFQAAGLTGVETRAIDVPTVFRDFDDYWTPFLGGQGPAPAYCASLPEDARGAARPAARDAADAAGRQHPPDRAGLGRARPQGLTDLSTVGRGGRSPVRVPAAVPGCC
ncbi:MAG TPA: class I SAM-dependent methyltransferase [Geminicoccaceae bacterium]|nr:class I SAM-dependent methyltransferase [Geminicoccaceae bacterium]